MNVELFFQNIGFIATAVFSIILGVVIFIKDPRKESHVVYFLLAISISIFSLSDLFGVNVHDPYISQSILIFTMVNLFTSCLAAHWAFSIIGPTESAKHKKGLIACYAGALILFVFFVTDTSRFLSPSHPVLYFPEYFNPGPFYWVFVVFFIFVILYPMPYLIKALFEASGEERSRIKYFFTTLVAGYLIGSLSFLTIFGVAIDPLVAAFFGLYVIPLAYGILKYELMDIRVLAKRALVYGTLTAVLSALITLISFSNSLVSSSIPDFPLWIIPVTASIFSVLIGTFVWEKIKEVDVLKYEFINNVTHKFRTPLTHIRWMAEDLREVATQEERDRAVEEIQYATMRLFELTNILIDTARDDSENYLYRFGEGDVGAVVSEVYQNHTADLKMKKQTVSLSVAPDLPKVKLDARRLPFAVQILFENALIYTPAGGSVTLSVRREGDTILTSIKDSGIGIPREELPHLFSKFYRAQNARRTDTEGMGIGLFMAKNIIEKHGGTIRAESEGVGKGSTFSFTLPIT